MHCDAQNPERFISVCVSKFSSAAYYTGCLILAPEICTVHRATDLTVPDTPNCSVLVP